MKTAIIFLVFFILPVGFAQPKFDKLDVENFQKELNAEFASKAESPLTDEDRKNFNTLDYFPA
ncbi:MAG: hypothetical protein EOO48_09365, partial [Flavobacterium sp.]